MVSSEIVRSSACDEKLLDWCDSIEDDVTIPRRRHTRRSSAGRRVSFAEENTIHFFVRDDDYVTPPELKNAGIKRSEAVQEPVIIPRRSPRFSSKNEVAEDRFTDASDRSPSLIIFSGCGSEHSGADMDTGSSTDGHSIGGCDVGDEAAGPVDIWHITSNNNNEDDTPDEDFTLDSHTFSLKLRQIQMFEISSELHVEDERKVSEPCFAEACVRGDDEKVEIATVISKIASVSEDDMSFTAILKRPKNKGIPDILSGGEKGDSSDMSLTNQRPKRRSRLAETPQPLSSPNSTDSTSIVLDCVDSRETLHRSFMTSSPENSLSGSLNVPDVKRLIPMVKRRKPMQELDTLESEQHQVKEQKVQTATQDSVMQKEPMEERESPVSMDITETPSTTFHLPTLEELLDRDDDQTGHATVAKFPGLGNHKLETTICKAQSMPVAEELVTASEKIKPASQETGVDCKLKCMGLKENHMTFGTLLGVQQIKKEDKPTVSALKPIKVGTEQREVASAITRVGEATCSTAGRGKDDGGLILKTAKAVENCNAEDSVLTMQIDFTKIRFSEHQMSPNPPMEVSLKSENYKSLFDCLKFVCLIRPEVEFLKAKEKQMHISTLKLRPSLSDLEHRISSTNPTLFSLIQTIDNNEHSAIQSYLKRKVEKYRLEIKLKFEREKLAWLQTNNEAIMKKAEAARDGHKRMKMLSDRCELLERRLSLALTRAREAKDAEKKQNQDNSLYSSALSQLRLKNQDGLEHVMSLRREEELLNQRLQELESALLQSLANGPLQSKESYAYPTVEASLQEMGKKNYLVKHLQGWQLKSLGKQTTLFPMKLDHYGIATQTLVRQGEGSDAYVLSTISLKSKVIDMVFPRVNAPALFEALLPSLEKHLLSSLPLMLQRFSFMLGNLVQVCKEVRECRIMFRGLDPVQFFRSTLDSKVLLRFSFTSYALSLKATINFEVECLQKGMYPVDILPVSIQITANSKKSRTLVTEDAIRTVFASVPSGYHRFQRLCQSLHSFLESLKCEKES